ncbi:hypothetical protein GCM10025738_06610 [Microbacterium fluvii]
MEHRRPTARAVDEPRRDDAGLQQQRVVDDERVACQQLSGEHRPLGIALPLVRRIAGETGRAAGHHEGADHGATPGEHKRQVRDVVRHQLGGPPRFDQMVRQQHDGRPGRAIDLARLDAEPRLDLDRSP